MSKQSEVHTFVKRMASRAVAEIVCGTTDQVVAQWLGRNRTYVALRIAEEVSAEYAFLELADIMEWKRSRVKR